MKLQHCCVPAKVKHVTMEVTVHFWEAEQSVGATACTMAASYSASQASWQICEHAVTMMTGSTCMYARATISKLLGDADVDVADCVE